jgi:SNF2 family DNA or RNA helicase
MWCRSALPKEIKEAGEVHGRTAAGLAVVFRYAPPLGGQGTFDPAGLRLHVEHARLRLLRGFEELLCLDGLHGVEQLPHQIETVRRVLRHFRGRVLLADEVGLGKTIEACLLLREYLLRGLAQRILILVPAPLVSQWQEELESKFGLEFSVADSGTATPEYWAGAERIRASMSLAKSARNFEAVAAAPWDLVIVDEAHHCKNRSTRNWQLVNALKRRHLFMLTATPVQNNLVELYNLLTLLEPGHLATETSFKRTYVTRGNPRDPRNRERLRSLLAQVMVRNTRSLVNLSLPPRYAQTFVLQPNEAEAEFARLLDTYLRWRCQGLAASGDAGTLPPPSRMQVNALLLAAGSHPATLVPMLERMGQEDPRALALAEHARRIRVATKEEKLLELLRQNRQGKALVFANFRVTLERLAKLLTDAGIPFSVFAGTETARQKDEAVERFRASVPVMLCSESGGEGRNLQFANTLINFDLPWNPMRIEQRVGRIHRIGQTREVFIFNLCTAGSVEERILRLLDDKIRMFELVVGEVGSILGNLEGGEEFESLVLDLWLRSRSGAELDAAFERLGESLLAAQEEYLNAKKLDDALFGEDYQ